MNQIEYFLLLFGSLFVPDKNYILHLFAKEVVEKEFLSLCFFIFLFFTLNFLSTIMEPDFTFLRDGVQTDLYFICGNHLWIHLVVLGGF